MRRWELCQMICRWSSSEGMCTVAATGKRHGKNTVAKEVICLNKNLVEESMGEKEVLRYLSLVNRKMDIYINSGINWKPEYEAELENIDQELAQLRHLIDNEHVRRNRNLVEVEDEQ